MIISKRIFRLLYQDNTTIRLRSYSKRVNPNPFFRTWNIVSNEISALFTKKQTTFYPEHADIVVIGGGFIGSSVAYWLKQRAGKGLSVVVLEKDFSYKNMQQNLSLGVINQHYSLPENIYLSQYAAEFLRNVKENLNKDLDIQYCPNGYLVLASEKYAEKLEQNVVIQKEHGIRNELLTPEDIKKRYSWMNTNDIKLGCMGTESEGLFNSWALLKGLIQKSQDLGAVYVNAEVVDFELEQQRDVLMEGVAPGTFQKINRVIYKTPDNEEYCIKFAACILAAGDKSGEIAKMAKVGTGEGLLTVPLPIIGRQYNVYSIDDNTKKVGLHSPLVMDTSGLWLKKSGLENNLICGHTPLLTVDVQDTSEEEYYRSVIKPSLTNRFPHFKNTEINNLGTEMYDSNTYDDTGILGPHPYHNNLYIAAGFGKQGCQHAPGIGRAIAELIIDSRFTSIDLTRFGFDRLLTDQPVVEFNVY